MVYTNGSIRGRGGVAIHEHYWTHAANAERRLLVVHGLGDHGGRYAHLADEAVRRGWEVIAPDLRGHGRSGGQRGHVRRFDDYLDDLLAVLRQHDDDGLPLAVFGHSMGGLVATRLAQSKRVDLAALALSSPLFGMAQPVGWFWRLLGRALDLTIPRASFGNGLDEMEATRDLAMLAERQNDRFIHNRVTARWFCEVTAALEAAHRDAIQIEVPLLVLQAGDDRMVCARASRRFFDRVVTQDKTYRLYDGHYHELLREITRQEIVGELLDWLDKRVPAGSVHLSS